MNLDDYNLFTTWNQMFVPLLKLHDKDDIVNAGLIELNQPRGNEKGDSDGQYSSE